MLFVYFHVMSIVRVHSRDARSLIAEYDNAAGKIDGAIPVLSPLVSEAMGLLERAVMPANDPMADLYDAAVGMGKDGRDVGWRLELIETGDSRPMGEHTVLNVSYANAWIDGDSVTLIEALIKSGLTREQAEEAEKAVNRGDSFNKAVADQWSDNQEDLVALADLNERIDNWNGTDNDPIFDQMLRERRELEARIAEGDERSSHIAATAETLDIPEDYAEWLIDELGLAPGEMIVGFGGIDVNRPDIRQLIDSCLLYTSPSPRD